MVGSGGDRRTEAVGMMALHDALRTVCLNSDWTYSVFWTIRPRPRVRGGNGCKVGDDNGSLLMGKVASDKCHKWVFKEPTESEPNISNYWQSSFDAIPTEWTDQFESGIQIIVFLCSNGQTIAVIQAGHGLLQLGSCKIIPEDLHFVLRMRHTFESLGYQSGFYISQLFSSTRNTSSSTPLPSKPLSTTTPIRPPPSLFNWGQRPLGSATPSMLSSPNFQHGFPQQHARDDETHMFLMPHASSETSRMEDMMGGGERDQNDIKWPNGLSFFNALTARNDEAKILFNPESLGNKAGDQSQHHPLNTNPTSDDSTMQNGSSSNLNEFLSLDSHHESARKMDKFKRSFPLSSASTSMDHHQQAPVEYRNSEGGMYSDVMDTILE
ncbi:unnamed protein product [Lupinus luteus]|uniref:Transcription factor MYC/MYB N-terminal domain-containing protein n=1 Tax=Lupinus luteus TaxID=3873 RepID=A0AAV1YK10_LUPLU